MKSRSLPAAVLALSCAFVPASAADDPALARMALCQDSWFDWQKSDPARLKTFGDHFRKEFSRHDNDAFFLPRNNVSVLGLHVAQAFPDSVGMGVGFSLTVDAPFGTARRAMEKALGRKLGHCESSDDMQTCELDIAAKRTVMLMAEDSPKAKQTLVGCYYFYEK